MLTKLPKVVKVVFDVELLMRRENTEDASASGQSFIVESLCKRYTRK